VKDARRAREEIKRKYFKREGIIGVGYSPGSFGGDNPHVNVTIDKKSNEKEERRGEIPERAHNTRVEIIEDVKGKAECEQEYLAGSETPGGLQIIHYDNEDRSGKCTLSSRIVDGDYNWLGWTTAGHCIPCPEDFDGTQRIEHWAFKNWRDIGTVVLLNTNLDIAVIDRDDGVDELSKVAEPDDPDDKSSRHHINGTASQNGLDTLSADPNTHFLKRGRSTCTTRGEIQSINETQLVNKHGKFCEWQLENQIKWDGYSEVGDSGSLVYSEPYEGNRYASHSHSGRTRAGTRFGPAGFAIRNEHSVWWDDI
jgi:hypothetical protein